jgi:hypothetical protein
MTFVQPGLFFPARSRLMLAGALLLPAGLFAEEQSPPEKKEPVRTHVLYMGANLEVKQEKKFYRVEDVVGSEFMIRINKKEVYVPTRQRTTGLKVDYDLKLSDTNVQLAELAAGPGYTPGNDPKLKFDRASGAAGGAMAVQNLAYGEMFQAEYALMASQAGGGGDGPGAAAAVQANKELQDAVNAATAKLDATTLTMSQSRYNTGEQADLMQKELAEGNYDAMDVSFKISSPVELDDPYMVILFKFLERGAKPGDEGMLIYAKALDPLGLKPQYIRVREGGMPVGFKYLDAQVHIYNHGQEVATNLASKRVDLTRDEARQYILIEHLAANKGDTVPASVMRGTLPRARRAELSLDQMNRTAYVKLSPDAQVLGVYQDEACQLALEDERYLTVVGEVLFKPALYKGKPVEGVARLRLGDI